MRDRIDERLPDFRPSAFGIPNINEMIQRTRRSRPSSENCSASAPYDPDKNVFVFVIDETLPRRIDVDLDEICIFVLTMRDENMRLPSALQFGLITMPFGKSVNGDAASSAGS